ncbi:OsmC family peroxiredoxin [Altererythrobacter salegens]|uniref:OsmC family peroxiredoxin n=1 Tax=Croceibacterium salegens TaxID=1737568 RepID=A0A6I4SX83_9SPHN|nr:OsmC family protein [Croceibacterium salegens]MXO59456.1 OsmC family peroxiredoxin [Croceibacterium salegens]
MAGDNILGADARPRFFPVETPRFEAPRPRLGISVRFAGRSLSAMQKEALVISSTGSKAWRLVSDEGAYLDGADEAPCPLSFLSTGMVAMFFDEIVALAEQRGIAIDRLELVQDNYYTMKGSALRGTMTGGAKDVKLEARIVSSADRDTLNALVCDAVAAAPVHGLLRGAMESLFTLTHNGEAAAPEKAKPVPGDAPPDLAADLDGLAPAPGDWSDLIVRGGMSPKTEEATSSQGSSLAEEQDRTLHVQVACTLREDGVKQVEQRLFNPHGSIFTYLCDEQGRAPDAACYVAAGIGFCFMTQLGRYAKIACKDLAAYRIVQDLHMSPGGATGGTGQAGRADPVETHVFLESSDDDTFARAALDVGEQTCFLHALCRTDVRVSVRLA